MATNELSINLLIDKRDKVCFAEAGSDVVEFLSGLLSLPLGTVANLLTKDRVASSIGNVFSSMEKLDANYKIKERRLSPAVAHGTFSGLQQLLGSHLINGDTNLFTCKGSNHTFSCAGYSSCTCPQASCGYLTVTSGMACHVCKGPMERAMMMVPIAGASVFTAARTTYTIKDDLSVTLAPNMLSGITLLAQCGVKDICALQEKSVKIGKEEALAILAASLKSNTVLTDVFLPKKNIMLVSRGKLLKKSFKI